jgi:hypothetical protein
MISKSMEQRLQERSKPLPNGCIEFAGPYNDKGYGEVRFERDGKRFKRRAHRVAYELRHGSIPAGALICHRCHNRKCINPEHLYAGNAKSNYLDMVEAGREYTARHLPDRDVRMIRRMAGDGFPKKLLARRFRRSPQTIRSIIAERMFKRVVGYR